MDDQTSVITQLKTYVHNLRRENAVLRRENSILQQTIKEKNRKINGLKELI